MQTSNNEFRSKQLSFLKMRVELIAWRIEEVGGMTPYIRAALPQSTVDVFGALLYATGAPDEGRLREFETAVQRAEEALARDASFWRSGNETLH
jgi:hypothetical protein